MIELENVTKVYVNYNRENRIGLDNVSVKLPDTGLVSFVGRSGNGKSTLLNVIGGLDKIDKGTIKYYNRKTDDLSIKDYDNIRKNFIGFIFQEFHLIRELTIYDNVKISLDLQGDDIDTDKKVNHVLELLEINHLSNSYPNELSGGEKQRVAIARVLVKGCKVILADEPTGNLDDYNAESIYQVLKNLSKNILVILVSHDMESVSKISDRVIKLSKGKVIEDKQINKISTSNSIGQLQLDCKKLNIRESFSLANKITYKKRKRLLFLIIFSIVSLLTFSVGLNFSLLDTDKVAFNTYIDNEVQEVIIDEPRGCNNGLSDGLLDTLIESYPGMTFSNIYKLIATDAFNFFNLLMEPNYNYDNFERFYMTDISYLSIVDSYEGNLLFGSKTLENNEIMITDYQANVLKYYSTIDFKELSELEGYTINMNGHDIVIKSIIDTDYEDYLNYVNDDFSMTNYKDLEYKVNHQFTTIYMNEHTFSLLSIPIDTKGIKINGEDERIISKTFFERNSNIEVIGELPNAGNEIVIPYKYYYESMSEFTEEELATFIGNGIELSLSNEDGDLSLTKMYKIVGIFNSYNESIILSNEEMYNVSRDLGGQNDIESKKLIMAKFSNAEESINFLEFIDNSELVLKSYISDNIMWATNFVNILSRLVLYTSIGLFIFAILLIYYFVSTNIEDNMNVIGVLRSLGGTRKDVFIIYVIKNFVLSFLISIGTIVFLCLANMYLNNYINATLSDINIIYLNPLTVPVVLFMSLLLFIVSSTIPQIKLWRKSLIDIIYGR